MNHRTRIARLLSIAGIALSIHTSNAAPLPASAEIYNTDQGIAVVKIEEAAEVSIASEGLNVKFPTTSKYPAVNFKSSDGTWDMSAYDGIEAVISNTGAHRLWLSMRIDNAGNWQNKPWSSDNLGIAPGETKTFTVRFGTQYGKPGFALDASKIINVKLLASSPKAGSELQLKSIKAVKSDNSQAKAPATPAPASSSADGVSIYTNAQGVDGVKLEDNAEISAASDGLTVDFPVSSKYPAVNFKSSTGTWDMSVYDAVEAVITNTGTHRLWLSMRIDNAGNWQNKPWSTDNLGIEPGETKTFTVRFGTQYGKPGFAFDASKIINVKLLASSPKAGSQLKLKSIKPIKLDESQAKATASTQAPASNGGKKVTDSVFFDPATSDINAIDIEKKGTVLSKVDHEGSPAVNIQFATDTSYPGLNFIDTGDTLDLSAFSGVQAKLHNAGTKKLRLTLRVDNKGHWKDEPWNTTTISIRPGETKDLRVTFGMKNSNAPGYPLDPTSIIQIKLFANDKQSTPTQLHLLSLTGVAKSAAGASSSTNFNAPPIDGAFYKIDANSDLLQLGQNNTSVSIDESTGTAALKVEFDSSTQFPNVTFPTPDGGWNMETFGGIQVDVTNPTDRKVTNITMRVDNPSTSENPKPWNNEKISLEPGETKTLSLVFGGTASEPKYPLDSTMITGIQVFQAYPKEDSTLLLKNLRAYGSPKATPLPSWASTIADRDIPVTPPEWLGTRPPVEGDWVLTFDENFDEGSSPNPDIWNFKLSHDTVHTHEARNTAENVYIEDGAMVIKAEVRSGHHHDDPKLPIKEYSSGAVTTYDKWAQCYGYIEARMKLPTARGLWPAFWTMPDRGEASGLGKWVRRSTENKHGKGMEIDILEHLTEWGPGRNNIATHWDGYGDNHKSWGFSHMYFGPTPDGWHTFGLLWEPGKLTWFIDGYVKGVWENERVIDVPSYLILNLQMGRWATKDVDRASLPDYFKIDYVRAWQLEERMQ